MSAAMNFLNGGASMARAAAPTMGSFARAATPAMGMMKTAGQPAAQMMAQGATGGGGMGAISALGGLGLQLWQTMQAGEQMAFQRKMAEKAWKIQEATYNENKDDRQTRRDVDYSGGLELS